MIEAIAVQNGIISLCVCVNCLVLWAEFVVCSKNKQCRFRLIEIAILRHETVGSKFMANRCAV